MTALYLLSMLAHAYNIIIGCGVGEKVHVIEVVDGLNTTDKTFLFNINLQLCNCLVHQIMTHT